SAFGSEPTLGRARLGTGSALGLVNGIIALVSILLVVSVCRKIATAFGDGRLEQRGRTVNSLIGMSIGGFFLAFILGMAGAGALRLLLMVGILGLIIAAIILYIMLLYGAKRVLGAS